MTLARRWILSVFMLLAACGAATRAPPKSALDAAGASDTARAWYLHAVVAEQRGDVAEAERAMRWVLRYDARSPYSHLYWGRFLERQRRRHEALVAYERAIQLDSQLATGHAARGLLRLGMGDALGRFDLQRAMDLGSNDPALLEALGRRSVEAGDPATARRAWATWSRRSDVGGAELERRARLAVALGLYAEAVDDWLLAIDLGQNQPELLDVAMEAAERGCRVGVVWRWARQRPTRSRQSRAWAEQYLALGERSNDPVLLALGLAPWVDDPERVARRGQALLAMGQAAQALTLVREARERWLADARFVVLEGLALAGLGRTGPALSALARLEPQDALAAQAVDAAVLLLLQAERFEEARARAEELALVGGGAARWIPLARVVGVEALPAQASNVLGAVALVVDPTAAAQWLAPELSGDELLQAVPRSTDNRAARALVDRWTPLHDDSASGWVARARVHPDERTSALSKALELDPCHGPALVESWLDLPASEREAWLERIHNAVPATMGEWPDR